MGEERGSGLCLLAELPTVDAWSSFVLFRSKRLYNSRVLGLIGPTSTPSSFSFIRSSESSDILETDDVTRRIGAYVRTACLSFVPCSSCGPCVSRFCTEITNSPRSCVIWVYIPILWGVQIFMTLARVKQPPLVRQ